MSKIIDISEHNGNINFALLKQSDVKGVIIRIGWIGNKENHTLDKKFEEYYSQAKYYGLKIGFYVYSYCNTVLSLLSGTNWVIDKIKNKQFEMPVFLDLEDNSISGLGKQNLTNQAKEFCSLIEKQGKKAGIYANKFWFENKLDIQQLITYKIWLAEWNGKEKHTCNFKVDLWQYTSNGKVNGINSRVDISKCLHCDDKIDVGEITGETPQNGDDVEVKTYKNGSTPEPVYSDTNLTKQIGSLNARENCECLGIYQNRAIVRYKVDKQNNYKIGFVKWLGGVK